MSRSSVYLSAVLAALAASGCLFAEPAKAVNLGDTPENAGLSPSCPEVAFLGPMVTAVCPDKDNLMIKSKIDVRACANYQVVLTSSGQIRCKARLRK